MNFFHRCRASALRAPLLAVVFCAGVSSAQDFASLGITDVVASADRMLQRGNYREAIPALQEVISRTAPLTDPQGQETAQTCRFQLARAYYQVSDIPAGMKVIEEYLDNQPCKQERMALRMMAQGFFDTQEWDKIAEFADRLLKLPDLEKEDIYNANLLLGQALFRLEKWQESVKPLGYAAKYTKDPRVEGLCQVMVVRALVEAESWRELFGWIPRIYRTDSKYDITLNLTLMKAGKARFDDNDYLNALLLYRMVLPREEMLGFADKRIAKLEAKLQADITQGIPNAEKEERQTEIDDIKEQKKTLEELPPYEDEVTFRIGQIYAEVKRYWEGYVLFDKLYQQDRTSEIGEASMLQSVLILYDVKQVDKAEQRILLYLDERPDGQYARTLLLMMMRDNLVKKNPNRVAELRPRLDRLPATQDPAELELQSDLHYIMAFGYFQTADYKRAEEQFSEIINNHKKSDHLADSMYYRAMSFMMQADYANALAGFKEYRSQNEFGDHAAVALFRESVCQIGLENVTDAEETFTSFIEKYPDDDQVSEAYSMRGDIEAAKEATTDDLYTLDRALADYRKAIDKAIIPPQASYPAFQAAKVFKLEHKWQEIIDLMNYYMELLKEKANVAEAVFWKGQAQIELGEVDAAVTAYLDAIQRFGNDTTQQGVDKVITELVKVSDFHLSEEDREGLAIKMKLKLTHIDLEQKVLRLRLQVGMALLQGEDIASAFGAELLEDNVDLKLTTAVSLALMCDAAVDTGNTEQMSRLSEYFITNYEESEMLWHAYRAKVFMLLAKEDFSGVLAAIEEVQGLFGADANMGWAQIIQADTLFKMGKYKEAEEAYNMCMGVAEWRGPIFAEAMYGMGKCRQAQGDLKKAHSFFQRTYLLFKSYADGEWAAKGYLAAADILLKLDRQEDAINTLREMLEDPYTNTNPLADPVRAQLKKYGE